MKAISWTDEADADLSAIGAYWSTHSPARTGEIADRIDRAVAFLAKTPFAGSAIAQVSARKWGVARTSYIIVYRISADTIEILRVHHAAENWRASP